MIHRAASGSRVVHWDGHSRVQGKSISSPDVCAVAGCSGQPRATQRPMPSCGASLQPRSAKFTSSATGKQISALALTPTAAIEKRTCSEGRRGTHVGIARDSASFVVSASSAKLAFVVATQHVPRPLVHTTLDARPLVAIRRAHDDARRPAARRVLPRLRTHVDAGWTAPHEQPLWRVAAQLRAPGQLQL
jgi:hypothetical protein